MTAAEAPPAATAEAAPRPAVPWRAIGTVLIHPSCWFGAVLSVRRLARPGWWRRAPLLPVPDGGLWGMRMEVAYGRRDARPDGAEVAEVLRWTSAMRRWSRR